MAVVTVSEREPLERALRRFKRQIERSGVLKEVRRRRHHEKPSIRKKRKALAARKRLLKARSRERRLEIA